jgi:hypothetical protein
MKGAGRRLRLLVGAVVLVTVAGGLVVHLRGDGAGGGDDPAGDDVLAPGGPPPPEVDRLAGSLTGDADARRAALSPGLAEALAADGDDGVMPPGSRLRLDRDGWRSEIDGFGGATGRLVLPGGEEVPVEVGLVRADGTWQVTYVLQGEAHEESPGQLAPGMKLQADVFFAICS